MLTRTIARFLAAALFATIVAFSASQAPAAQAAELTQTTGAPWDAMSSLCTIRSSYGSGFLGETNGALAPKGSTQTQWVFYRSGSAYGLKLLGTDKFLTASGSSGVPATLQPYNPQAPNSQLWSIQRTSNGGVFIRNVGSLHYLFEISGSIKLFLGNKSPFFLNSSCAQYYSF
jgi:hypothetical protein